MSLNATKSKDKLDDNGVSQDELAEIDDFNNLDEFTSDAGKIAQGEQLLRCNFNSGR